MPKGEFQNRDRDETPGLGDIPLAGSLGELPPDIADERHDLDTYNTKSLGTRFPDMQSAQIARIEEKQTGIGSPLLDYTVRSIYDSRPTSGFDFNLWFTFGDSEIPLGLPGFIRTWAVPQGYVAVIRDYTILAPAGSSISTWDGLSKLLIDGTARDPIDVRISNSNDVAQVNGTPYRVGEKIDTFIIADENSFVGLDVTFDDGSVNLTTANFAIGFHGNFLLKTGRPAMFEVANLAGKAKTAVTSSPREIASGSELVQKRRRRKPFANVPILRR